MGMNLYEINEPAAFYFDEEAAAHILAEYIRREEKDHEGVQALLATNMLNKAVKGELSLEEFKEAYPQYDCLSELLPEEWIGAELFDIPEIIEDELDGYMEIAFHGTIKTHPDSKDYPIDLSMEEATIAYLVPEKTSTSFTAAYADIEELADEYKRRLTGWLPDDFDYTCRICVIDGTEYH